MHRDASTTESPGATPPDAERERLAERERGAAWGLWGPYLAERQWGTVREDYSANGDAWEHFPHDHARSRAYRWGEDGILGISDAYGRLCFAVALWNEADPILKERLFGLTGPQGNHGEDVKEVYAFEDATPTHSYLRATYRYPQRAYPYDDLVTETARRGRDDPEYELLATGIFDEDRFFDVTVEYAKVDPTDLLIRITAVNRGPDPAPLHMLPTLWYRNRWAWDRGSARPDIRLEAGRIHADHQRMGDYWLAWLDEGGDEPDRPLFTGNETNTERLWGVANTEPFTKDGIGDAVVDGRSDRVDASGHGTKVAIHRRRLVPAGGSTTMLLRLSGSTMPNEPFARADDLFERRRSESDAFYRAIERRPGMTDPERLVFRQAIAGLIWSKQHYEFDVGRWLDGDPAQPAPPPDRRHGRNAQWRHLNTNDVLLMPDTWEYPWFAAWDLAFHCVTMALVDPAFAKRQVLLLTREWYAHPNGQVPAYEWNFDDVNPPVHAWAAWRVYTIDERINGTPDRDFLERVFHKLLLNFTWWVNRKDRDGRNVFQGGFLGLDNIGVFDRSATLPGGALLEQADGTAWMGFYSLAMLRIALELAQTNPAYEDVATKFFEHFLLIAGALNGLGENGVSLWDTEEEFYYDVLHVPGRDPMRIKLRTLVGLIALFAVEIIEPDELERLPGFARRMDWFLRNRPDLAALVGRFERPGHNARRLLAMVFAGRGMALLKVVLDESRFLGPHGVRSLSRWHAEHPFDLTVGHYQFHAEYEPAESRTGLFGGNSNWRGPVWFPLNYLLIEALRKFHRYYGDDILVEFPAGSGRQLTLSGVADELSRRMVALFTPDESGRRPANGPDPRFRDHPLWRDRLVFHEYFNGDTGEGLGASHQTGWTALVASILDGADER